MKRCSKCGADMPDDAVFCTSCGAKQNEPTAEGAPGQVSFVTTKGWEVVAADGVVKVMAQGTTIHSYSIAEINKCSFEHIPSNFNGKVQLNDQVFYPKDAQASANANRFVEYVNKANGDPEFARKSAEAKRKAKAAAEERRKEEEARRELEAEQKAHADRHAGLAASLQEEMNAGGDKDLHLVAMQLLHEDLRALNATLEKAAKEGKKASKASEFIRDDIWSIKSEIWSFRESLEKKLTRILIATGISAAVLIAGALYVMNCIYKMYQFSNELDRLGGSLWR